MPKDTSKDITTKQSKKPIPDRHDAILPIQEPYMQQITTGEKTYEFRKYQINPSVERIWFYRSAPHSSIEYVCEVLPARTRGPNDDPLEDDGIGNKEFNEHHVDWEGYDFAYKILSVYQLDEPLTLADLKSVYGMKAAPQGLMYTPATILERVDWKQAVKIR